MAKAHDVDGNRLSLLTEGPERLDTLVALIDTAQTSLKLLYYIYADDAAGQRIHNALIAAAARGVKKKYFEVFVPKSKMRCQSAPPFHFTHAAKVLALAT